MTKQVIGIGTTADDGTGDQLRTAFNKTNLNFTEVYLNTTASVGATWVGAGGVVSTPINDVFVLMPIAGTITKVTILTVGGSGSCSIDIYKGTYAAYPPSASIVASAPPAISAGIKYQDATLTGWTTAIAAGDILGFHLTSSSTFTIVNVILTISHT